MAITFKPYHYVLAIALLLADIGVFAAIYASIPYRKKRDGVSEKLTVDEAFYVSTHASFMDQTELHPETARARWAYTAQSLLSMVGALVILMVGLDELQL